MELPINDKYRLRSDHANIILEQITNSIQTKGKKKGEAVWLSIGFYSDIKGALEGYCEHCQRASKVKGWDNLQKLTERLYREIQAISDKLKITVTMKEGE